MDSRCKPWEKRMPSCQHPERPISHSVRMGQSAVPLGISHLPGDTEAEYGDMAEQTEVILKRMKLHPGGRGADAHYRTSQRSPASSHRDRQHRLEPVTHEVRMRYFGDDP